MQTVLVFRTVVPDTLSYADAVPVSTTEPQDGLQYMNSELRFNISTVDFTLDLPDELLEYIFGFVGGDLRTPIGQVKDESRVHSHVLALLKVCRRWRILSTPILYYRLQIWPNGLARFRKLWSTLVKNDSLFTHVRILNMHCSHLCYRDHAWKIIHVLRLVKGYVRELELSGHWQHALPTTLIKNIAALRAQRLQLSDSWHVLLFEDLMRWGDGERLRVVELSHCSINVQEWKLQLAHATRYSSVTNLSTYRCYTANIDSIALHGCHIPLESLYKLLSWPRSLKRLSLSLRSIWQPVPDPRSTQRLFDMHHETLEEIEICTGIAGVTLHFASFVSLKSLITSAISLFRGDPRMISEKLATPSLEVLTIDTWNSDARRRGYSFTEESSAWLITFVQYRCKLIKENRLKLIRIIFEADENTISEKWPWRYLKTTASILSNLHITLDYHIPPYSERGWKVLETGLQKEKTEHISEVRSDEEDGLDQDEPSWKKREEEEETLGDIFKKGNLGHTYQDPAQRRICSWIAYDRCQTWHSDISED